MEARNVQTNPLQLELLMIFFSLRSVLSVSSKRLEPTAREPARGLGRWEQINATAVRAVTQAGSPLRFAQR